MAAVSDRNGAIGMRCRYGASGPAKTSGGSCERHAALGDEHVGGDDVAAAGGGHAVDVPRVLHLDFVDAGAGSCAARGGSSPSTLPLSSTQSAWQMPVPNCQWPLRR